MTEADRVAMGLYGRRLAALTVAECEDMLRRLETAFPARCTERCVRFRERKPEEDRMWRRTPTRKGGG